MGRYRVFFLLVLVFAGWVFQVPLAAAPPGANAKAPTATRSSASSTAVLGVPGNNGTDPSTLYGNWSSAAPVTGTIRLLIVAVEFNDVKHTETTDELSTQFFGDDSSLTSYFDAVSYGQFTVTGTVAGWYNVGKNMAYYGADGNMIDNSRGTMMPQSLTLVMDAQNLATKDTTFTDYDYLMVIHAGNGQETCKDTNTIWSVAFTDLHDYGKMIFKMAAVIPETEDQGVVTLGVWVHEFSHLLGLPDMYQGHKRSQSSSHWELMDYGAYNGNPPGTTPAEWSAWSRLKVGWLPQSSVKEMTPQSSELVLLKPLEETEGYRAVKVSGIEPGGSDYYMIEVRRPTGYDEGLPDQGVVVYHFHETPYSGTSMSVIDYGGDVSALHHGASYSSGDFSVKVVASYPNGDCLIGLGDASNTPTQTSFTLLVSIFPVTSNMTITVDDNKYVTDASGQVSVTNVSANTSISFTLVVPDTFDLATKGSRLKFVKWANNETSTTLNLALTTNSTITANYKVQDLVSIVSQYGDPKGGGWYDQRTPTQISVTTPVPVSADTRYVFQGWTGDFTGTNNPTMITVVSPMTITVTWVTQYLLSIDDGGKSNGTQGQGWYNQGTLASFALISPGPDTNGTWYVFHGWTGDFNGVLPSGTVTMDKPMVITAMWLTLEEVNFVYVTGFDGMTPVIPTRVSQMQLTSPNGTTQTVMSQQMQEGVWLESGQYSVINVLVFGINTAYGNQTFTTSPKEQVSVRLELYDLTFDVKDMLFSTTINGASINVTLTDGTVETIASQSDGKALLEQLPKANYPYKVTSNMALDIKGEVNLMSDNTVVPVRMVVFMSIGIVTAIAIAATLGLILFLRRRGGGGQLPGFGRFGASGRKTRIMAKVKGKEGEEGEDQLEEATDSGVGEEHPDGTEPGEETTTAEAASLGGETAAQTSEEPNLELSFAGTEAEEGNAEDRLLKMLRRTQQS